MKLLQIMLRKDPYDAPHQNTRENHPTDKNAFVTLRPLLNESDHSVAHPQRV